MPTRPPAFVFARKPFFFDVSDDDAADRYRFTAKPKGDALEVTWACVSISAKGKVLVAAETLEGARGFFSLSQGGAQGTEERLPPFLLSRAVHAELSSKKKSKIESLSTGKQVAISVVRTTRVGLRIDGERLERAVLEVQGKDLRLFVLDDATWPFVIWRDDDDNGWHLVAQGANDPDDDEAELSDLVDPQPAAPPKGKATATVERQLARLEAGEQLTLAEAKAVATHAARLPFAAMRAVFTKLAPLGAWGPGLFRELGGRRNEPGFVRQLLEWYFEAEEEELSSGIAAALTSVDDWHEHFDLNAGEDVEKLVALFRQSDQDSLHIKLLRCFARLRTRETLALFLELFVSRPWQTRYTADRIMREVMEEVPVDLLAPPLIDVLGRAALEAGEWRDLAADFQAILPDANARGVLEAVEKALRARKDARKFKDLLSTLYDRD